MEARWIAMTDQRKRGRPSDYTDDIATAICDRLAKGESLRAICATEGMPDKATVLRWEDTTLPSRGPALDPKTAISIRSNPARWR
jgi:hypothetical protein